MNTSMNDTVTDDALNKWDALFRILNDAARENGFEFTINNYDYLDKDKTNINLDLVLAEIGSYYNILHNKKLEDSGNYNGLLDFMVRYGCDKIRPNDKLPDEVINMLTTTGIQNVNTCLDLYKLLDDDKTATQLSDTGWFTKMSYGLTVDDIMKSFVISDRFNGMSKNDALTDIVGNMMISAGDKADFSILKRINSIDTSCLPGSILKPILINDFIAGTDANSASAHNWLINNMNAAYDNITAKTCSPSIVSMMLQYEFDNMADNLYDSNLECIMASSYEINDVNMYANAIITALFLRILLTEILSKYDKLRDNSNLRYNMMISMIYYDGNLKHITEFICNQLADNIDKPIELIRELIISDMQDIITRTYNEVNNI